MGERKLLRTGADEIDMRTLLENQARGLNGIAQALHAGHSAGFHSSAIHEQCIELHAAVGGEEAAAAGVEGRIIFKHRDGCFDGIEG